MKKSYLIIALFLLPNFLSAGIVQRVKDFFTEKDVEVSDRAQEVKNAISGYSDISSGDVNVADGFPQAENISNDLTGAVNTFNGKKDSLVHSHQNHIRSMPSYLKCQNNCVVFSKSGGSPFSLDVLQKAGEGKDPVRKKWANPTGYGKGREFRRAESYYLMRGSSRLPGYLVFDGSKGFFLGDYKNKGTVEIWVSNDAWLYIQKIEAKTIIVHAKSGGKLIVKSGSADTVYVRADKATVVDLGGVAAQHVIVNASRKEGVGNIRVCPKTTYSQLGGSDRSLHSVVIPSEAIVKAPKIIGSKKYKTKRFLTSSVPRFFKKTVNAVLFAGGVAVVGAAALTLVSSVVMGIEHAVGSSEFFDKIFPSHVAPEPGDIVQPNGSTLHPDGEITYPEGLELQPDGDLLRESNGDIIHPDGSISHPNGSETSVSGVTTYPEGTALQADGTLLRASNGDIIHPDGSVTRVDGDRYYLNGDIGRANGDIVKPNGNIVHPDGTITRVNGDVYNPATGDVTHLNGSVSHADGRTTLANGDILRANGERLHTDGSVTRVDGVRIYTNGDRRLADGTIIRLNGDVVRLNGSIRSLDGTIVYPSGTTLQANGDLLGSNGDIIQSNGVIRHVDGSITEPDGDVFLRDGTIRRADGSLTLVNGDVRHPNGNVFHPNGSVTLLNGDVRYPNGDVVHRDGTITRSSR